MKSTHHLQRAQACTQRLGLRVPVLMAPMAGVPAVGLAAAVAQAGGMAALGALLLDAKAIADWVQRFRAAAGADAALQINLWVPDPAPRRNAQHEAQLREFLSQFGPPVPADAADTPLQDFSAQCQAVLAAKPRAVSSIMGVYPPAFVRQLKAAGILWLANVTTVAEARAAAQAGADVIVAQGAEAGGHRGAFEAPSARDRAVGLFALLPQVVDAVDVPVVATGGIGDARGVAAALMLGASAVQIGTALLHSPEAGISPAWAQALKGLAPEDTQLTRAFSGRWGRAISSHYVRAAAAPTAPKPAPYPVQRGLTAVLRKHAEAAGNVQHMQAWAGQGSGLVQAQAAADCVQHLWQGAQALLQPAAAAGA
jgi:nitronate monooxygenase